jgi:hypothetical protein
MLPRIPKAPKVPRECAQTTPVGACSTWEDYCYAIGVDPQGARKASVVGALWAMCGGDHTKGAR